MVSPGGHRPSKQRTESAGEPARPKTARTHAAKKSAAATPAAATAADSSASSPAVTRTERHQMIERAAYLRSQQRGFAAGFEMEDWLAAEAEVDRRLTDG